MTFTDTDHLHWMRVEELARDVFHGCPELVFKTMKCPWCGGSCSLQFGHAGDQAHLLCAQSPPCFIKTIFWMSAPDWWPKYKTDGLYFEEA